MTLASQKQTTLMNALRKQFATVRVENAKAEREKQASRTARLMSGKRLPVTL